ncbi:MAG: aldehyde ferredoxin oxidoreductase N-terminal domain-containing protein [bacterium]
MGKTCGFAGRILELELSGLSHAVRPLDPCLAASFLGGFGINQVLFHGYGRPRTPPLDPANPIIFGAGPLVGTLAPGAARVMATTRFPLTGAVAAASGSMGFGPRMKWAGYDHVVVLGKAPRPVCVVISGDAVRFVDAGVLWGKGIHETTAALKERFGAGGSVTAIGPAGEACVPYSFALTDVAGTIGRGGLGAVMGAKNLKAVYVRPAETDQPRETGAGIRVHDRKGFLREVARLHERARAYPLHGYCVQKGLMAGWELGIESMFRHPEWTPAEMDAVYGQKVYERMKRRRFGCPSCFICDKDLLAWEAGSEQRSAPFTSYINVVLAAMVGIRNPDLAAEMLFRLDDAGLDLFVFGRMVQMLRNAREAGSLPLRDDVADELERDETGFLRLLDRVIRREGVGELFHSSLEEFAARVGPDASRDLVCIKGQDALYDPRDTGLGTMEFEQIVCPRGPTSACSGSPSYLPGQPLDKFKQHAGRMGASPEAAARIFDSPFGFHVGRLSRYSEDWYALFSALGVCNRAVVNRFYHVDIFSRLYSTLTGIEKSPGDLMADAERIWNLLRLANRREGFTRADDRIPEPWFEPKTSGGETRYITDYFRTSRLTRSQVQGLLEGYYEERGWDPATGHPTAATLARLGLQSYAEG